MDFIVFGILILLYGLFSISKHSIIASKKSKLEQLANDGKKGAKSALKLRENSEMFLSVVLMGMMLVCLTLGALSVVRFVPYITPFFEQFDVFAPYIYELSMVLVLAVIAYIAILLGEMLPKFIALSQPEKVASFIAPAIIFFSQLFYPFVKLISVSTRILIRIFGIKEQLEDTEYELRQAIKSASLEGVIEEEQTDMHEKVFHFSDKRAVHLMTHRTEVEWIDLTESDDALKKELNACQHTKVVCADGSLDNFKGVIHIRDFYKASLAKKEFQVADLIKEPVVIHENTSASMVLKLLKQDAMHFCVVVDEYGDFEGVITFHDIMENLIGDVPDEGEVEEPHFTPQADGAVIINGDAPVEILTQILDGFNVDFEEIDYATVAGFVIDQINEIPKEGDTLSYLNYEIDVLEMDGNRIDKILVKPRIDEEDETE